MSAHDTAPGQPGDSRASAATARFHRHAETALADAGLRQALVTATGRLAGGRTQAFAAIAGGEDLRDAARRIRATTIAQLDRHLEQFAAEATRRGTVVHWAETAADARRIVLEIAQAESITLAVKSKSMVSEEIALNPALSDAGIEVVETDLGEYVVQVADDRPSHIITPIIHWTQDEVGQLFRDKLGATAGETASIPAMTAFARRTLRERFLTAGMGISGVNMAVAESGSICLVTNEGNGRLCTTAPRVHVALMGLERIVPTAADLGQVLQVLARSATGQALSVYTNIITGPRRRPTVVTDQPTPVPQSGEPDGPERLHVVIIDNGRSQLLGTSLAEMLYCIRCGACLNVCPVYRHIGGHAYDAVYPGPMGSVVTPGLSGLEGSAALPHASSLCGACRDVCPVRIDLPHLLLELRATSASRQATPWWLRLGLSGYAALACHPTWFRWAGRVAHVFLTPFARAGRVRRLPGPLSAWTATRDFPVPVARSFTARWHETRRSKEGRT